LASAKYKSRKLHAQSKNEKSEMAVTISGVINYLTTIDLRDSDISVRATAVQVTVRRGAVVVVVAGLTVVVRLGDVVAVVVVVG
jgi:hypothetical protein